MSVKEIMILVAVFALGFWVAKSGVIGQLTG